MIIIEVKKLSGRDEIRVFPIPEFKENGIHNDMV